MVFMVKKLAVKANTVILFLWTFVRPTTLSHTKHCGYIPAEAGGARVVGRACEVLS